jgi:O-methyltransferase involved in polyketide biosynthesis
MTTGKLRFSKDKETMLMTLYARAIQSQWAVPILRDPWAEEAIRHIDYDFAKLIRGRIARFLWADIGSIMVASRAGTFDRLTIRYLTDYPDAVVLHLGCGMDSRVFRVDPPTSVTWFDVDYPDVIDLRRQLYSERPAYHLIGSSLNDLRWLDDVPEARPALVVAEGVFPYLAEGEVRALLHALTQHFPQGQMVFDAMPSWVVRRHAGAYGVGAYYQWALDDPQDLKLLEPPLSLIKEFRMRELVGYSRFPLVIRAILRAMEISPALRRMDRILVYRWGEDSA